MSYQPIDIQSSYRENDLGRIIYDTVVRLRPTKVIEFGTLKGYSAVAIAMALRDNNHGHLFVYDIWEKYPFKHGDQTVCLNNLRKYGLSDRATLDRVNFWEWIKKPGDFDLLHIDISNTGHIVETVFEALKGHIGRGSVILFE